MRKEQSKIFKHKRMIAVVLTVCFAICLLLILMKENEKRQYTYVTNYVSLEEVCGELVFTGYSYEEWEEYFAEYHKEYLTCGILRELTVLLGVEDYIEMPEGSNGKKIERQTWNGIYEEILDFLDMKEDIVKVNVLVLDWIESEENNIVITNEGDFSTRMSADTLEQWQCYEVYCQENQILGVAELASEECVIANAYLISCEDTISFLYGGGNYEVQTPAVQERPTSGVCDLVFQNGTLEVIRQKQDTICGTMLSYDEESIEIQGYGVLRHTGKLPVYQTFGELSEKSISDVVLGNMEVTYVTGDGEVCAILMVSPANVENIRVLLLADDGGKYRAQVFLKSSTSVSVQYGDFSGNIMAGEVIDAAGYFKEQQGATLVLETEEMDGTIVLCDSDGNALSNGYYGTIEVRCYEEGFTIVNQVPIETYLAAVVPSEMPSSYEMEALKAQAVCARSYAYIQMLRADLARYGAHISDSTSYQVYNKVAPVAASSQAVAETAGQVLTYNGDVIEAYYFSTSMGYTDTAAVWNLETLEQYGYLQAVCLNAEEYSGDLSDEDAFYSYITSETEGYDSDIKFYRWTANADYQSKTDEIKAILEARHSVSPKNILYFEKDGCTIRENMVGIGKITGMTVKERSTSGTILTLQLQFANGIVEVKSEYNIRKVLGCGIISITYQDASVNTDTTMLPSAFCTVCPQEDGTVLLFGGGYGHGIGMSQNAANSMAKTGMNYEDILQYFYKNIKIEVIW
jgi:stage II sporulation protein D